MNEEMLEGVSSAAYKRIRSVSKRGWQNGGMNN